MATVTQRLTGDQWVQIPATWEAYSLLDEARGETSNPRLIYADGRLTVVTKGYPHERLKMLLAWMIETMLVELPIEFASIGEMTLKLGNSEEKGVEADAGYYFTNRERLLGKRKIVIGVDPAPDLAVEIVVSHPVEDSLAIYSAFGVSEVWVCREGELTFLIRDDGGRYQPSPRSRWLPFLASDEMSTWLFQEEQLGDRAIRRNFKEWLENTLFPRFEGSHGENS